MKCTGFGAGLPDYSLSLLDIKIFVGAFVHALHCCFETVENYSQTGRGWSSNRTAIACKSSQAGQLVGDI